jgi:Leucine-rich repeat (LRR) protein
MGEKNPLSENSKVEIISISTVTLPDQELRRIPVSQLKFKGIWQGTNNGYGLLATNGLVASVSLNRFMPAGIDIIYRSDPQSGLARIIWDGIDYSIDLYAQEPGTYTQSLKPSLDWHKADLTRKILVAGAVATDFLSLLTLTTVCTIVINQLFSGQAITLQKPGLILLCLALIVMMQFIAFKLNDPVIFENNQLESAVRDLLGKPTGELYERQLMTIVKFDASNKSITNLDGIELLPNLIQLNLSDNSIKDIAPLSNLKQLKELNLRNNSISDLTPLSKMADLEYLNIHSNSSINSIKPLENLSNLHTLIMGNVPIRDEIHVLENFDHLRHLNIRNCGIKDLKPFSQMNGLEYLNLYSNSEIQSIKSLENLTNLRTLILANIPIADEIDSLKNLTELRYLNLRNTDLSEISALSNLANLEYLNLHSNPDIKSIAPLQILRNLQTLILRNVPIGNEIDILRNFPDLQNLNIRNCGITDVSLLGELMSKGMLQDNPKINALASIDIRDNLIPYSIDDQYAAIRPFWENISDRQPISLPFFAALSNPKFSQPSGFYEDSFLLTLSTDDPNANIYFSLDGSEPSVSSQVYSESILITSRAGEPNQYSAIESIAADWNQPESEVAKATIVRAKVINKQISSYSATVTHTYFLGLDFNDRYTLPILSLVADPDDLFNKNSGIYVLGESYAEIKDSDLTEDEKQLTANFNQHGREWERPIHIEFFENGEQAIFSQNGGVRIHGGGSRRMPQKSLRIYAGSEYDLQEFFEYPLFTGQIKDLENKSSAAYKVFLLKNSGQDWMVSMIRDPFIQDLVSHTQLDTQSGRPVIVFLNGEYWGIYNLQERYDEYYFSNQYNINPNEVTILRQNGVLFKGNPGDQTHYSSLLGYISKNNLSDPHHYEYIQTQMDVDNYIDYLITEIYTGNNDWPDKNIYLWRKTTDKYSPGSPNGHDGRWRWMIIDMDFGFGLQGYGEGYKDNTLELAQKEGWSGFMFRSLLENRTFRIKFINRFTDHMNSTFKTDRVVSVLDQTHAVFSPEMEEFFMRWDSREDSLEKWGEEVETMRIFAQERPEFVRQHIMDQFSLNGTAILTVNTDEEKGYMKINSIDITTNLPGVENPDLWSGIYFKGIPLTITAIPKPGYRFSGWEGIDDEELEITFELSEDLELSVIFVED